MTRIKPFDVQWFGVYVNMCFAFFSFLLPIRHPRLSMDRATPHSGIFISISTLLISPSIPFQFVSLMFLLFRAILCLSPLIDCGCCVRAPPNQYLQWSSHWATTHSPTARVSTPVCTVRPSTGWQPSVCSSPAVQFQCHCTCNFSASILP